MWNAGDPIQAPCRNTKRTMSSWSRRGCCHQQRPWDLRSARREFCSNDVHDSRSLRRSRSISIEENSRCRCRPVRRPSRIPCRMGRRRQGTGGHRNPAGNPARDPGYPFDQDERASSLAEGRPPAECWHANGETARSRAKDHLPCLRPARGGRPARSGRRRKNGARRMRRPPPRTDGGRHIR